jgi:hypothetical protein
VRAAGIASLVSLTLRMVLANFFKRGANLGLPLPDAGRSTNRAHCPRVDG